MVRVSTKLGGSGLRSLHRLPSAGRERSHVHGLIWRAVWFEGPHDATVIVSLAVGYLIGRSTLLSFELRRVIGRNRPADTATRYFSFERMMKKPDAFGVSLMVDIDHFTTVNDTHGHLAGDGVIEAVGQILQAATGTL